MEWRNHRSQFVPLLAAALVTVLTLLSSPLTAAELDGELTAALSAASPGDLLPVNIIMGEQADAASLEAQAKRHDATSRRILVASALKDLAARSQAPLVSLLEDAVGNGEARDIVPLWIINAVSCSARPGVISRIAEIDGVARITLNPKRSGLIIEESPAGSSRDFSRAPIGDERVPAIAWGVTWIGADDVWAYGIRGEGVLVAMMDTGIDYNHTDLVNRMWHNPGEVPNNGQDDDGNGYIDDYYGYDFGAGDSNPMDDDGHGTHTAGTVGGDGAAGTSTGVAPSAALMACKVLVAGYGDEADVWEAIQYAVDNGADVASFSIGWIHTVHNPDRPSWRTVCENAIVSGLVMVVASGNEQNDYGPPDDVRTPGDVPGVITVGATRYHSDTITSFSSEGPVEWNYPYSEPPYDDYPYPPGLVKPDVCAPGENVNSTVMGGGYSGDTWSGTSMATPHVAGLSALLLDIDPALSHEEVKIVLESTALHGLGDRNYYGEGRVQAFEAASAVFTGLGTIEGHVEDAETGAPLAALVRNLTNNHETWSDAAGFYSMPVVGNATYTLEVSLYGYRTTQATAFVPANGTVTLDFLLPLAEPGILAGWVRAASTGDPIQNATVSILSTPIPSKKTNANGLYYFLDVPGSASYNVRASASGYITKTEYDVYVGENDTTLLDFDLEEESEPCPFSLLLEESGKESNLALLHEVRDDILRGTPLGESYIRAFYDNSPGISRLLISQPSLFPRVARSIEILARSVRILLSEEKEAREARLVEENDLAYITHTLELLSAHAQPGLREFLERCVEEAAKYKGKTAGEARALFAE